jgi:IclR helix-turn-helix domain
MRRDGKREHGVRGSVGLASPPELGWTTTAHPTPGGGGEDQRVRHADREVVASETVSIELSPAQVDRVIRTAAEGGSMSLLLSGLRDVREVLAREPSQMDDNRLSRSLLAGLLMLATFPTDGSYLGNAEIARLLDMNPSTTHRYVSTLVAVGLLERDPITRRYRLV